MSPHRGEIEDLLVLRQRGETMKDGTRPTEKWFLETSGARWGMPLNKANIHTHFSKHFKPGNPLDAKKSEVQDARTKIETLIREKGLEIVPPEQFLELIVSVAHKRALADPASITVDQGMKAVAELTKRKHDEQTASLMAGLVGAVQTVAQGVTQRPEPEVLVVSEAEVVESGEEPESDGGSGLGGEQGTGGDAALVPISRPPGELPGDQES
jgi:hypothetical protein